MEENRLDINDVDEKVFRQNLGLRIMSTTPLIFVMLFGIYLYNDWAAGQCPAIFLLAFLIVFVPFSFGYYFLNDSWESIVVNSEGVTKRRFFKERFLPWSAVSGYSYIETDRLYEGVFGFVGIMVPFPTPSAPHLDKTDEPFTRPSWRYRPELTLYDEEGKIRAEFIGIEWALYSELLRCLRDRDFEAPQVLL